jgi:hypothetical protein
MQKHRKTHRKFSLARILRRVDAWLRDFAAIVPSISLIITKALILFQFLTDGS